jgi:hypothetical protein
MPGAAPATPAPGERAGWAGRSSRTRVPDLWVPRTLSRPLTWSSGGDQVSRLAARGHPVRALLALDHYNSHRPHRALQQNPPAGRAYPPAKLPGMRVLRRDRLGGLIHEYAQVA